MTTATPVGAEVALDAVTEAALAAVSGSTGEPDWLVERRLEAFKRYLDQPWPDSRKDEYWRSTPFERRFDVSVPLLGVPAEAAHAATVDHAAPPALVEQLDGDTALVRIVDGEVAEVTVPAGLAERGVVVTDLATAATEHSDLVREHLGALTTTNADGTGAAEDRTITVNDAAWTAGAFVYVPPEVELDAPIGVHVHVTRAGAHLPRVLAIVDHHAVADVYLEHTGGDGLDAPALVDEIVEVVALEASRVRLASLQEWGDQVQHLSLQKVAAHRGADVKHLSITVGGATVRLRPEFDLVGPGAQVRPLGIYFADAGQWFDLQPYIRHLAPKATSNVLFKGALQGRSRTVFRGNVYIHRDAAGTVTDENNKTLILTAGARADSTPFLEIECSDVIAGHGSATGQIDFRHLFYLEARGIPRAQALRLIVHGFFREVLEPIDLPGIEDRALAYLEEEIAHVDLDQLGVTDVIGMEE